jgi:demethylmenaquinone methyltransferase/2-methoxy-6-polyprenyl-1,4-benzoquinol methylase
MKRTVPQPQYDDAYVQALFDKMGRTYDFVNMISSFGFSATWRRQCVAGIPIRAGNHICDMMAGTGECWSFALEQGAAQVTSVDFSRNMVERQNLRRSRKGLPIDVRCENATATSIPSGSVDGVVCAFGLKTLDANGLRRFAHEISRILKPSGYFSLLEISLAEDWWLGWLYRWYLSSMIPIIGKLCLGDIECYRKLGVYTKAFGSCATVEPLFRDLGLEVSIKTHFFGCATSIVGWKISKTN